MRNTISPVIGRLLMPVLLRQMFGPLPVPDGFRRAVPPSLMVRPWQLRASAAEAALIDPRRGEAAKAVCGAADASQAHCRRR